MGWIILIVAGLFETGFASCLGRANETKGTESMWWYAGFVVCLTISMLLLMKAAQTDRDRIFGMDGNRSGGYGFGRDFYF